MIKCKTQEIYDYTGTDAADLSKFTFQWYTDSYDEVFEEYVETKIEGATSAAYTVNKAAKDDFYYYNGEYTRDKYYLCKVYLNGEYYGTARVYLYDKNTYFYTDENDAPIYTSVGDKLTLTPVIYDYTGAPVKDISKFTFQWYKNDWDDDEISCATSSSYTFTVSSEDFYNAKNSYTYYYCDISLNNKMITRAFFYLLPVEDAPDGFVKSGSTWYYYENGKTSRDTATVIKDENRKIDENKSWWYVDKNGKVDTSYTGFASNSNGKWYIENGKVTFNKNSVIKDTTGAIGTKGTWYYVVGSKVQTGYTGVANYKNANGWWYIKKGAVDFTYTGFSKNNKGTWYVEKGQVTLKQNSVIKDSNGAIGTKGTWYYVVGSKVQTSYTGVANYKNASGWWYIKNGKVDFTANTVAKNKNGWWYVVGGKVQLGYTGVANYKNASGWWYVKNGKVDFKFTGIASNKNGTWYVKDGKVRFDYSGKVKVGKITYTVKKGKVIK